ncbi:MAG: HD-GYP domain-containing protein [Synergistaceae bacterium]|jgi:HD-GYP domain-containing protein (c-di-GMP phosphodiesterase class II)|nr:HD-GYP domain-containing protein [Synergistaceae bacterium]
MSESGMSGGIRRVFRKRIPFSEVMEYASVNAVVAEDISVGGGMVLLSRGTTLSSLVAQENGLAKLEASLTKWGMDTVPISITNEIDVGTLLDTFKTARASSTPLDNELVNRTVTQLTDVYSRLQDGACGPEDIHGLADQGRVLASEVGSAPQVMMCLSEVKSWDEYTYVHSLNVALLGSFLASRLYPDKPEIAECLAVGGILHDLGKAKVPQNVLNKPGKLTDDEFDIMKRHPTLGEQIAIENGVSDPRILSVIRGHHERYGGNGYPDSVSKNDIQIEAKIAAVADVFDALTAKRVYKDPMNSKKAIGIMVEDMGSHFDPEIVRALLLATGLYPPGSVVELSDGSVGIVVGANKKDMVQPTVCLKLDQMGRKLNEEVVVDLNTRRDLFVHRVLADVGKAFNFTKP